MQTHAHTQAPRLRKTRRGWEAMADGDPALRPAKAAGYIGVSRTTLWRLQKAGQLPPPIRITEHAVAWRRSTLDAWLAAREIEGPVSTEGHR